MTSDRWERAVAWGLVTLLSFCFLMLFVLIAQHGDVTLVEPKLPVLILEIILATIFMLSGLVYFTRAMIWRK